MSIIDSLRAWSKAKKITVSVIAVVAVAAIGVTIFLINRNMILATTMRLLKIEGTVTIEDASGNVKPVIDNIRFQSGDTLSTGADGLASIGLDDTKIVTLQNDSSAQFIKNGKQIELKLKQGGVFFEVTEKLTDDETYEIETSNMTVGIRGTSGYVWYDESGLQSLVITDGKVLVSGHNPQTGETKTVEVCGGQQVSCFLYNDITEERTSIEFELKDLDESELPEFPLQMLAENPDLMEKVCNETGWDKDELLALVDALLDPDNPTPTPDAIIEITDTPTATPEATEAPLLLITPTTSPTPTPKPTNPLSVINNVINDMIPDPTGTPEPSKAPEAPTPTPATTPVTTSAPIPTVTPTTTESPIPTVKPTTTPTTTVTPVPTVTAAPTDEPTPEVTPEVTPEPTPEPTATPAPADGPVVPDGYEPVSDIWGVSYKGNTVYICKSGSSYMGWLNDQWITLSEDTSVGGNLYGGKHTDFYYTTDSGNLGIYYGYDWGGVPLSAGIDAILSMPDGYSVYDAAWDKEYDGHEVYAAYNADSNDYMAYNTETKKWFSVEKSGARNEQTGQSSNYLYYIDGEGQMVYYYSWSEG